MDLENRKNKLKKAFKENFNSDSTDLFSSSGRMEILGNHTDHNNGLVLVGAVDLDIMAATEKCENEVVLISENYGETKIDSNNLQKVKEEEGTNAALIKGVLFELKELGYHIGGFKAYADSILPAGSGISSSAAFECLIAEIENFYYNNDSMDRYDMAKIGQFAEKEYFGKPCGLLDQCGVAFGGVNLINFKNLNKPVIEHLSINIEPYHIVITNTGGDHSNLTSHYAAIPEEMKSVAKYFHKKVLAKVKKEEFYAALPELRKVVSDRAILRAIHFYDENERVKKGFRSLKNGKIKKFLEMVNESGNSSMEYLQNTCVPGSVTQNINLALALSKHLIHDGACRIHGGGFEGTILAFVHEDELEYYVEEMAEVFGKENVHQISIRNDGSKHLN